MCGKQVIVKRRIKVFQKLEVMIILRVNKKWFVRLFNVEAHGNAVTCALFAPFTRRKTKLMEGQIIVTCDSSGEIKVFENKDMSKPV